MTLLVRTLMLVVAAAAALTFASPHAGAQALGGRRLPYKQPLSISFYKIKAGFQDEWIDLYLKCHKPLLDYDRKTRGDAGEGERLYTRGAHMGAPVWDFATVHLGVPPKDRKPPARPAEWRGDVILKVFPNQAEFLACERRRWEITEAHWDDDFIEIDLTLPNPSVFGPISSAEIEKRSK